MSSSASPVNLAQKTFFVMSGASRGIGQTMTIECASKFTNGSVVVLLARSAQGLEETKSGILAKNQANITVFIFTIDLSKPTTEELDNVFSTALANRNVSDFQSAIIVHNVGTIGDVSKLAKTFDNNYLAKWQDFFSLNIFSVAALNNAFLRSFEASNLQSADRIPRLIVNITTKAAIEPIESFTLYCSSRAAREMYFRVLALEEAATDPKLTVLNYAPGPVETSMVNELLANTVSKTVKANFKQLKETKTILKPLDTTLKFIKLIEEGGYKSGDHVDYYEV